MSRNVTIALAVVAGLIAVCYLGFIILTIANPSLLRSVFDDAMTRPEEAAAIGREIATYTLPATYTEQAAFNFTTTKMVIIIGRLNTMALVLMQFPSTFGDEEQMRQQLQESWGQQTGQSGANLELIEERPVTVRHQNTTLAIYEGTDSNGNHMRQEFASFTGENGIVMLMATGIAENFDQQSVDQFLESIR